MSSPSSSSSSSISFGYLPESSEFYDEIFQIEDIYAEDKMEDKMEDKCFDFKFDKLVDIECISKKHKTVSDMRTVYMAIKSHKGSHNASKKDKLKMHMASKPDRTKSVEAKKMSRIIRSRN